MPVRHSALTAARGLVACGPLTAEVRGELPIPLATSDGTNSYQSSGYAVGAALGVPVYTSGDLQTGLVAEGQLVSDSATSADGRTASQQIIRAGVALQLRWVEPRAPALPPTGGLLIRVVDA